MRKFVAIGPALVVFLAVAAVLFAGPAAVRQMIFASTTAEVLLARQSLDTDDILARIDRAITNIATSVEPSIVHIEVNISDPDSFRGIGSSGAGWVYDTQGHIVTNAHVVSRADAIRIEFADGRTMMGELVASDAFTDIAIVKIDPGVGLIPMRRATGDRVGIGERVFAFGSPFNFKFSMSEGIISGLGRNPETRGSGNTFTNYIQTDAAVNPGNSGGPLVDIHGKVVGMNVAIATGRNSSGDREGQSAGISFAIPLAVIESVVDQIIETGQVRRGFLGIRGGGNIAAEVPIKDRDGNFHGQGILVGNVTPGQAADRAGIQENDIIAEIDGNRITKWHQLRSVVSTAKPDSIIDVTLWRDGEQIELPVSLAEFPEVNLYEDSVLPILTRRAGLGIREYASGGVYVSDVLRRFPAQRAGFEPEQEIVSINGEEVADRLAVFAALGRANFIYGEPVEFVVIDTEGNEKTLTLRLTP